MNYDGAGMAANTPSIKPYVAIALLGAVVAYQSWDQESGSSGLFLPGLAVAGVGAYICLRQLRQARANRPAALPAAPAEFTGMFAPDFRRNLEKLYQGLGKDNPEMTLEEDYAFWYNDAQSIELVLTPDGWMAFFQLSDGEHNMEAALVQRAVADSPFATHPVAQELAQKYCDLPVSGIAWCTRNKMQVYPYTSTEDFTLRYAGNLFAPAAVFDDWLPTYLATGEMNELD